TFLTFSAGFISYSLSLPSLGLTRHHTSSWMNILSTHPWRQPTHGMISSNFPAAVLLGSAGSAKDALPIATRSALPDAKAASATIGSLILPTVITGIETTFL